MQTKNRTESWGFKLHRPSLLMLLSSIYAWRICLTVFFVGLIPTPSRNVQNKEVHAVDKLPGESKSMTRAYDELPGAPETRLIKPYVFRDSF